MIVELHAITHGHKYVALHDDGTITYLYMEIGPGRIRGGEVIPTHYTEYVIPPDGELV